MDIIFKRLEKSINKKEIIKHFPNIQIPDEFYINKANNSDTFIALPKGRKCILWFTTYFSENIPILLYLDNNYNIVDSAIFNICFDDELTLGKGTIITGILFKLNNIHNFACTDIHYYKGQLIEKTQFKEKLKVFENLFKYNIKQTIFNKNTLVVGLPVCKTSYKELISFIECLPYTVHAIKLFKYNSIYHSGLIKYEERQNIYAFFNIKATLEDDIYDIYCSDRTTPYSIAMISDFSTSVMMNTLFRKIKENENLDLLELSDDDDEFEDVREDKFVDLDKSICMKCVFTHRFKKWKPVSIAPKNTKAQKFNDIFSLENRMRFN
jgi:hypothetical protein